MLRSLVGLTILFLLLATSAPAAEEERVTLAVTPFRNVMGRDDVDWMSEGFAETITSKLNYVRRLRLVERVQMDEVLRELKFAMSDLTEDQASRLGQLLNADFLVIGSYQKLDIPGSSTLKINARVVRVSTGAIDPGRAVSVAGQYADVFAIQDDVASKLARNLGVDISDEELRLLSINETVSVAAYELYNLARYETDETRKEQLLLRALELDPSYAKAHLRLGSYYLTKAFFDASHESVALLHLMKAVDLEPGLSEAHYALGDYYHHRVTEYGDEDENEAETRRNGLLHLRTFVGHKENSTAKYYIRKVRKARRMIDDLES
jgi:TolB-like protein